MTTAPPPPRYQLRERATRTQSSAALWRALALALGKIIGERGFESLFFRCVYQSESRWPWLAASDQPGANALDHLAACLATRDPAEAESTSLALLDIFTDTLILLIGELVTNRILLAAWGTFAENEAPERPQ